MICSITPTRGDRAILLERCKHYVERQTVKSEHIIIDRQPKGDYIDLTERFLEGLVIAKSRGFKYAFTFEDDDWYSPNYIETYLKLINGSVAPTFGIGKTFFLHLGIDKYRELVHYNHSSNYSGCINLDTFDIEGVKGYNSYINQTPELDYELFERNPKALIVMPKDYISIGIKHTIGKKASVWHDGNAQYNVKSLFPKVGAFKKMGQYMSNDDLRFYQMIKGL